MGRSQTPFVQNRKKAEEIQKRTALTRRVGNVERVIGSELERHSTAALNPEARLE